MPKRPKHNGRCEIRYGEDGEIDEVLVYDGWGRCLVHMEDMGNWFFVGVGPKADAGFAIISFKKKEKKELAVRCSLGWCNREIKGHRPEGI